MSATARDIILGRGLIPIPEELLLAHAQGRVLFVTGAGTSKAAGLPDFRKLVVSVYRQIDAAVHEILVKIPPAATSWRDLDLASLNDGQAAEVRRFVQKDYDVTLGMLERRMDPPGGSGKVREAISVALRDSGPKPAKIHRALMRLADRGSASTIITTNFDRLLEDCRSDRKVQSYSLGGIPRPGRTSAFSGVLHIHGMLDRSASRTSELIVTDHDFGEFYLRRRSIADFIYDAARLFHLVLVGYSANDPPMRYLLNAVAADGSRFEDLKERYVFHGMDEDDRVEIQDWRARGITPIPYKVTSDDHAVLENTLQAWARLSAINVNWSSVGLVIRRISRRPRNSVSEEERELFDHILRRSNAAERIRICKIANETGADFSWITGISEVLAEA